MLPLKPSVLLGVWALLNVGKQRHSAGFTVLEHFFGQEVGELHITHACMLDLIPVLGKLSSESLLNDRIWEDLYCHFCICWHNICYPKVPKSCGSVFSNTWTNFQYHFSWEEETPFYCIIFWMFPVQKMICNSQSSWACWGCSGSISKVSIALWENYKTRIIRDKNSKIYYMLGFVFIYKFFDSCHHYILKSNFFGSFTYILF